MIDYSFALEKLKNRLEPKGPGNPPASYQASQIGRPCPRYLYFMRNPETWALRKPFDSLSQYEMDRGSEREAVILGKAVSLLAPDFGDWIFNDGWRTVDPRLQCRDDALDISGRIDALCTHKPTGKKVAVEVKTMSTHIWERIRAAEDFRDAEEHYLNGYYGQLQAYLYNLAIEDGLFILEAKERPSDGQMPLKFLSVTLDIDYFQKVIERIQTAQTHRNGKPPEPIPYTEKGCGNCPFLTVCGNNPRTNGTALISDVELLEMLRRRDELKPASSEYDRLDKNIKERLKGVAQAVLGEYYITGKEVRRKGFTVKDSAFWQTKIEKMEAV